MELEDIITCSKCQKNSIVYLINTRTKSIAFYIEPHLELLGIHVKHYDLALKKILCSDARWCGIELRCPVCGHIFIVYELWCVSRIPSDVECEDATDDIVLIPMNDPIMKKCILYDSEGESK